jgi:hypothetical protein
MKLFVDDERKPPCDDWEVARNALSAYIFLNLHATGAPYCIEILSLDHDLGEDCQTGYDVAAWLEEQVYTGNVLPPKVLKVHSANPVGRARIL